MPRGQGALIPLKQKFPWRYRGQRTDGVLSSVGRSSLPLFSLSNVHKQSYRCTSLAVSLRRCSNSLAGKFGMWIDLE